MIRELHSDNRELTEFLRATHEVCEKHNDVATASLIENCIDETERRNLFLREILGDFQETLKRPPFSQFFTCFSGGRVWLRH